MVQAARADAGLQLAMTLASIVSIEIDTRVKTVAALAEGAHSRTLVSIDSHARSVIIHSRAVTETLEVVFALLSINPGIRLYRGMVEAGE